MNSPNRHLLAVALTTVLASPLAMAGQGLGQLKGNVGGAARVTTPAAPTVAPAIDRIERAVDRTAERAERRAERTREQVSDVADRTAERAKGAQVDAQAQAAGHSAVAQRDAWARLDLDADGRISSDEASADAALSASFGAMDADGDGFVSDAEYRSHAQAAHVVDASAQGAANAAGHAMVATRAAWAALDVDGDGRISAEEAAADTSYNLDFAKLDVNGDGYLDQDEYRAGVKADAGAMGASGAAHAAAHSSVSVRSVWARLDADGDGRVSATEATAQGDFAGGFSTMDSDGDGFVTEAEYRAHAKATLKPQND